MEIAKVYQLKRNQISTSDSVPMIGSPSSAPKPKLLDQVRQAIRSRHLSYNTEQAYVGRIKRFIFFHKKRHPKEMAELEIGQFLSSLATDAHVAASTQNQALNALLFLYNEVLERKRSVSFKELFAPRDLAGCPLCLPKRKCKECSTVSMARPG
jgi:hypothetical protein